MPHFVQGLRQWFLVLSRKAQAVVVTTTVLALAMATVVAVLTVDHVLDRPCMRGRATVVTHQGDNGECVGITDGSYAFDPRLRTTERAIRQENRAVTRAHPKNYVSVVLLLPISAHSGSIMSMASALEQVRGAYTAQYYANRDNVEGVAPYIQLLIGSDGYQANQWRAATRVIEDATAQHVAAVTGLGLSLDGTRSAVRELTGHDIPVFGATITADTFSNIRNFVRVAPSNQENMAAALSYVQAGFSRAVLVEDGNAGDSYDATLVSGFRKFAELPHHQIVDVEPFDTTRRDRAATEGQQAEAQQEVATRISQMALDICAQQPAVVLFAGRGQDVGVLVHAFASTCLDKKIRIISGDDVPNLAVTAQLRHDLGGHVTLDYAGIAHPDQWSAAHDPAAAAAEQEGARGFRTFDDTFQRLFPGGPLSDGNTMTVYDATLTGISAIRLTEQPQPRPEAVANELGALQGIHKVLGSSGPIQFTADYQTSRTGSNPVGKASPILRLGADGRVQVRAVAWPPSTPSATGRGA
jgi:ABC-type branched-subunit amino acid transport system substrate-binding protein